MHACVKNSFVFEEFTKQYSFKHKYLCAVKIMGWVLSNNYVCEQIQIKNWTCMAFTKRLILTVVTVIMALLCSE